MVVRFPLVCMIKEICLFFLQIKKHFRRGKGVGQLILSCVVMALKDSTPKVTIVGGLISPFYVSCFFVVLTNQTD